MAMIPTTWLAHDRVEPRAYHVCSISRVQKGNSRLAPGVWMWPKYERMPNGNYRGVGENARRCSACKRRVWQEGDPFLLDAAGLRITPTSAEIDSGADVEWRTAGEGWDC